MEPLTNSPRPAPLALPLAPDLELPQHTEAFIDFVSAALAARPGFLDNFCARISALLEQAEAKADR